MSGYNKFASKNTVLTKELNNVTYELMVKTVSDMVYVDEKTTLTEVLANFTDLMVDNTKTFSEFKKSLNDLVKDSNEQAEKIKDVWNYVNLSADPKSTLIELINSKVDKEDGKGLSTNDFTDVMKEKLVNNYSKEELDDKFYVLNERVLKMESKIDQISVVDDRPNISDDPNNVRNNDYWFQIISNDSNKSI